MSFQKQRSFASVDFKFDDRVDIQLLQKVIKF